MSPPPISAVTTAHSTPLCIESGRIPRNPWWLSQIPLGFIRLRPSLTSRLCLPSFASSSFSLLFYFLLLCLLVLMTGLKPAPLKVKTYLKRKEHGVSQSWFSDFLPFLGLILIAQTKSSPTPRNSLSLQKNYHFPFPRDYLKTRTAIDTFFFIFIRAESKYSVEQASRCNC